MDKENCPIKGRNLCDFVGSEGCENCTLTQTGKKVSAEDFADSWDVTVSLLPDEIDSLHDTETCSFCKGEKGDKIGYEYICLKHKEPLHKKGMFFGFGPKMDSDVGSLIDLPVSVCKKCKARFAVDKYITLIGSVAGAALALIILFAIPGVEKALTDIFWAIPLLIFIALTAAGFAISFFTRKSLRKKYAEEMYIDPAELPVIKKMLENEWKFMQASKKGEPALNFKKTKLREHMHYKRS